jgi:fatty acid desaturase
MNDSAATVLPGKEQYFRSLLQAPPVAWPTIGLFVLALLVIAFGSTMALTGRWPLWGGMLVNGFAMYLLFSVAHDGSHRAISRNRALNETIGRIGIMMLLPVAPFEAVRWIHMQHHRLTNSDMDPDQFAHNCPWWLLFLKWSSPDIFYLRYYAKHGGKHFRKYLSPVIAYSVVFIGLIIALTIMGHGLEVLFLWFFASRIGLFLISMVFSYLPHLPGDITAEQDVYKASTIRRGWEWLLTPLLVYQNYHLIHHLYPTAPFYTYLKILHLKYDELAAYDPAIQEAFGLTPIQG